MKHTIIAMLALIPLTVSANSKCYQSLSNNYQDSHVHRINVADQSRSDRLIDMSYTALRILYEQSLCGSTEDIRLKCGLAVKKNLNTEVCYGEGEYGYFLISKDYLDNLNIIFNRWD